MSGLPIIPDDDADFTPELARKIVARYQEIIENYRKTVGAQREHLDFAKAILSICAADFSTGPGTVQSCAAEINNEFQRRMEAAGRALVSLSSGHQ